MTSVSNGASSPNTNDANAPGTSAEFKSAGYEIFILALTLLSVLNWVLIVVLPFDQNARTVILMINLWISAILLVDFFFWFFSAHAKLVYFFEQSGWADLLGSPPIPGLALFRLVRVVRGMRLLRKLRGREAISDLMRERASSTLLAVFLLLVIVIEFGSILVLEVEASASNANIKTASDALWWGFVTIATVGYGDKYPVTNAGRVVGVFVMTAGVGLFGVLGGFVANYFLSPNKQDREAQAKTSQDQQLSMQQVAGDLQALREELRQHQATLEQRLGRLEHHVVGTDHRTKHEDG